MYPEKTRNKTSLMLIAFLVLTLIGILLFMANRNNRSGLPVEIFVVPTNAQITIDGKKSGTSTRLEPGKEYTFVAEREGFARSESTVLINRPRTVVLILEAVSEEAKEYATKNQKLYLEAEGIVGRQSQEEGRTFIENNPILNYLPHNGSYYRIDYSEDSEGLVVYINSSSAVGRQVALEKIRSWGYEPHDYRIDFPGLTNPFKKGVEQ